MSQLGPFLTRWSRLTDPLYKLIIRLQGLLLTRSSLVSPAHIYDDHTGGPIVPRNFAHEFARYRS